MTMNIIEVRFATAEQAERAHFAASPSPYFVASSGKTVAVGSMDTSAASLVAWFASNHGGLSFTIITPPEIKPQTFEVRLGSDLIERGTYDSRGDLLEALALGYGSPSWAVFLESFPEVAEGLRISEVVVDEDEEVEAHNAKVLEAEKMRGGS